MVEGYKEAAAQGNGSAVLDGKMIDYAVYKMGLDMIAGAEGMEKKALFRKDKVG